MDLPLAIFPNPECSFRPGEPRVPAIAGRRNGGQYASGVGIDLLNAILSDLEEVLPIECRSGMRGGSDGALQLATRRIHGIQLVS